MCRIPAPLGKTGCLELLSTDLFWPPVRCVVEGDDCSCGMPLKGGEKREISQCRLCDYNLPASLPPETPLANLLPSCKKESIYQTHFTCEIVIILPIFLN